MKLDPFFTSYENELKWTKELLNIIAETVKFL